MIKLSRPAAAAAAAVLAFGAGSAALATTSASAAVKPALHNFFIQRCTARELRVWVKAERVAGSAGTTYYHLEFRNDSWVACSLDGWPVVSAADGAGMELGVPAVPDTDVRARHVDLVPGDIAHARLGYVGSQVTPACGPTTAMFLKVTAPHNIHPLYTRFAVPVCSDTTSDLTIGRIRHGV